ncbi:unnamed protein product [Paramecium octaurelia]|uniref:Transmembrane protein n=1 Tax=Paramecium octaurelia TaxID=43137 RepID=A0A8S1U1L1_PAROT|nr:unnamed protein product [Paramecium octaurelia]
MIKSLCSLHEQEEEKYICAHPTCLKQTDNKLSCSCCFQINHREKQSEQHQIITLSVLEKTALANYVSFKEYMLQQIEKNSELHVQIEKQLSDVLLSLTNWQNNQKKMFNDITENSSQVLTQNIQKADNLIKNPSLDTYIYFYKFNQQEIQDEMQDIRDLSTRQLKYQLNQFEMKSDVLINQRNFIQRDYFLSFAKMNYQIELDNLNNYQFELCEKHLSQKEVLCTHPLCLQKNPLQLQCSLCFPQVHKEHQQEDYIKTIAIVMKEQTEKKDLIEQLKKKYHQDIKKSIDLNLQKINESQQNQYQNNEQQKEQLVLLEQQQLSCFLNPEIPNYIFGHLDQNLLTRNKKQISFDYDSLYHNYELKLSKIISSSAIDELKLFTELDFNSKIFNQYIINLENDHQLLQLEVQEKESIIQSNKLNISEIKLQLDALNDSFKKQEKEISNLKTLIFVQSESQNTKNQNQYNSMSEQISNLKSNIQQNFESMIQKNFEKQDMNFKNISSQNANSQEDLVSKIGINCWIIIIGMLIMILIVAGNGTNKR